MPAILDPGADLGELDLGYAGLGDPPPGNVAYGAIYLLVTANRIDLSTVTEVHAARCTTGWDQPVAEARITLTSVPAGVTYGDTVTVEAGRGVNNCLRFSGIVREWDLSNWPKTVTLLAKSAYSLLEDLLPRNPDLEPDEGQPGISLDTLLGHSGGGTLREIVTAVLNYGGLPLPAFLYDPPHVYASPSYYPHDFPENFTWRAKETALAYLHRIFEATAGARLFTSGDGLPYLAQIVGRPRGEPDLAMVEGCDILEGATGTRSITQTRNAVRVYGADAGDGDGPLMVEVVESNDFQTALAPYFHEVSSDLIETTAFATDMANYWLAEMNRELVHAQIPTYIDSPQGPAQTHLVVSPRIGVNGEPLWVLSSELAVDVKSFTITNSLVGGGIPTSYDPLPV